MSPETLAIFNSSEYQDLMRQKAIARDAKDYQKQAELFFREARFGLPKEDVLNQLDNGANFLTGGAAEAKEEIEKNTKLLAAHMELNDLSVGQDIPGQSSLVVNALIEFVHGLEDTCPGTLERAAAFVRENIEHNKQRYRDNPETF